MEPMDFLPYREQQRLRWYLSHLPKLGRVCYLVLLFLLILALMALPFCSIPLQTSLPGTTRPVSDRFDIRSPVSGQVLVSRVWDGRAVSKADTLLWVANPGGQWQWQQDSVQLTRLLDQQKDLWVLLADSTCDAIRITDIKTENYRLQYASFQSQRNELKQQITGLQIQLAAMEQLAGERIIPRMDMHDRETAYMQALLALKSLEQKQREQWGREQLQLVAEISSRKTQLGLGAVERDNHIVRAGINGKLQLLQAIEPGSILQMGAVIATIIPQDSITVECWASPAVIPHLYPGQPVSLRVDAYDPRVFGVLQGRVWSMDHDAVLVQGKPLFRVRCTLDQSYLQSPSGQRHYIKYGWSLQARFLLTRKTLWQLLTGRVYEWLHVPQNASGG
ncbi:MAG: HlyD family efflux transporter periplasmic adaptor subunit [Chitinophagaceae bacterium]|nr:HlyD family efflux transporter periplasmic adaptor subunit [Chitinophagaceae bacterium]